MQAVADMGCGLVRPASVTDYCQPVMKLAITGLGAAEARQVCTAAFTMFNGQLSINNLGGLLTSSYQSRFLYCCSVHFFLLEEGGVCLDRNMWLRIRSFLYKDCMFQDFQGWKLNILYYDGDPASCVSCPVQSQMRTSWLKVAQLWIY